MASSTSRRLSFSTGSPISCRSRDSAGVATTGCLRRAFITEPGPIRTILTHLAEPLRAPPVSPARGPPTDWPDLVQVHDDRDVFQASPDELPAIDIHSL